MFLNGPATLLCRVSFSFKISHPDDHLANSLNAAVLQPYNREIPLALSLPPVAFGEKISKLAAIACGVGISSRYYLPSIFERELYFAGSVERRISELHEMFSRPEVRAIFCARGGYGCNYLLPHLDLELIRANPKIFAGCSDVTTLLTYLATLPNLVTFHAPMVAGDFARPDGIDEEAGQRRFRRQGVSAESSVRRSSGLVGRNSRRSTLRRLLVVALRLARYTVRNPDRKERFCSSRIGQNGLTRSIAC